jgi:hypothetical protein
MPNSKRDFIINFRHGDKNKYITVTPTDYGGKCSNFIKFLC